MVRYEPSPIFSNFHTHAFEASYEENRQKYDSLLKTSPALKAFLPQVLAHLHAPGNHGDAEQVLHFLIGDATGLPSALAYPDPAIDPRVQAALRSVLKIDAPAGTSDHPETLFARLTALNARLNNWGFDEVAGMQGKLVYGEGQGKGAQHEPYFAWMVKSARGWPDLEIKVRDRPDGDDLKTAAEAAYRWARECREKEQRYDDKDLGICARVLTQYPSLFKLWGMQRGVIWRNRAQYPAEEAYTLSEYRKTMFYDCATPALEARMKFMVSIAGACSKLADEYEAKARELMETKYPELAGDCENPFFTNQEYDSAENALREIEHDMKVRFMKMMLLAHRRDYTEATAEYRAREIAKY